LNFNKGTAVTPIEQSIEASALLSLVPALTIASKLIELAPGSSLPQPHIVAAWFTPELFEFFQAHAEVIVPRHIVSVPWPRKLQCLTACLTYAMQHEEVQPYFGFGCYILPTGQVEWFLHALNLERDGTIIDSSQSPHLILFYGVKLGLETFSALPRKGQIKPADLPEILRRPAYPPERSDCPYCQFIESA
jgi:hypothetical protein